MRRTPCGRALYRGGRRTAIVAGRAMPLTRKAALQTYAATTQNRDYTGLALFMRSFIRRLHPVEGNNIIRSIKDVLIRNGFLMINCNDKSIV